MRRFKWIEWNLQKIAAHSLSADEVEAAFDRVYQLDERRDGSYRMFAEAPSGRRIWVIWRYDHETMPFRMFLGRSRIRQYLSSLPIEFRMNIKQSDLRSEDRKLCDEQIAGEPQLAPPDLPVDIVPRPMEALLPKLRQRPLALMGIVENGLVRPLDPQVKLPEQSRVIIVAAESA